MSNKEPIFLVTSNKQHALAFYQATVY